MGRGDSVSAGMGLEYEFVSGVVRIKVDSTWYDYAATIKRPDSSGKKPAKRYPGALRRFLAP